MFGIRRRRDARLEASAALGPNSIDPLVQRFLATLSTDVPGLYGGAWSANTLVERVGTAVRCLQLTSQTIAALPLRYRRRTGLDPNASDPAWLANPDPAWFPNGIADALFAAVWSMYRDGDAFVYITSRYSDGYPQSWTVLDAQAVDVDSSNGRRTYASNGTPLNTDDVVQVTRNPTGALRGSGALESYGAALRAAYSGEQYAAGVFGAGGIPPVVLQSLRRLTGEQAADVQGQWVAARASSPGAPAILPPELTMLAQAFSPKDMALLDSREFDSRSICAAFGVPAMLLNLPVAGGLTYQNPAMLAELWWKTELMPNARRLEAALSLMVPRGNWVEFDASTTLRPDLETMVNVWSKLLADGIVTEDEYRVAVLDLPPLSQGQALAELDEPAGSGTAQVVALPPPAIRTEEGATL